MSKVYKNPQDYVEEISAFPPAIAAAETAIPAFIGYTPKAGKLQVDDLLFTPTRIASLQEYEQYFGTRVAEAINVVIEDELVRSGDMLTPGPRKLAIKIPLLKNNMHYHLQLYFANGGGPCYIVSTGRPKQLIAKKELKKGLDEVYQYAEPTLIVFPDGINLAKATDLYQLYNDALMQAQELGDRFVIMDISHNDLQGKTAIGLFRDSITGGDGTASLQYGAVYYPLLHTSIACTYADSSVRIQHNMVTKETGKENSISKGEWDGAYLNNPRITENAVYAEIKNELAGYTLTLAASSAIAGIYAAVDKSKGVWKAPVNMALSMIKEPVVNVSDAEQDELKTDTIGGKSANTIRYFTDKGTLVWGGRTLAGNDAEWRYISVRRFFSMVEKSVKKAIHPFIFENNDANTWTKVRAMIENFLLQQWNAGALAGAKPEHAFFVRVGLRQTMTEQDILEGRMNIEIGMAMVKPAEFIIIRMVEQMQQN